MIKKKYLRVLFIIYLLVLLKLIVFKYPLEQLKVITENWSRDVIWEGLHTANFQIFHTIKLYIRNWNNKGINSFDNIIGNIIVFIPFSYMLPRVLKVAENFFCCMSIALIFISGIEFFQLLSAFGCFDVDDIILNMSGALIGYLFYLIMCTIMKNKNLNE